VGEKERSLRNSDAGQYDYVSDCEQGISLSAGNGRYACTEHRNLGMSNKDTKRQGFEGRW